MPNIIEKLDFGKDILYFQPLADLSRRKVVKMVRNVNVMWKLVLKLSLTR